MGRWEVDQVFAGHPSLHFISGAGCEDVVGLDFVTTYTDDSVGPSLTYAKIVRGLLDR